MENRNKVDLTPFLRCAVFIILIAACAHFSNAATYVVTKTADTSDGICDADCSFREAYTSAYDGGGSHTISFGPLFNTPQTIYLDLGTLFVKSGLSISIVGPPGSNVTFDGRESARFFIMLPGAALHMKNLRLVRTGASVIWAAGGILSIENCVLDSNRATEGGALFLAHTKVDIRNSTFSQNKSVDNGGAILMVGETEANITDSVFENNASGVFRGGGAIYNGSYPSVVKISRSTFRNNKTAGGGGAVYNDGYGLNGTTGLQISESLFVGNEAFAGGGGLLVDGWSFPVSVVLTNTTFAENRSLSSGGAIRLSGRNIAAYLVHNTIAYNLAASYGAGIDSLGLGQVFLIDSLLAGNVSSLTGPDDLNGYAYSDGYNLIQNTPGGVITGTTATNIIGMDARLGLLGNYGGPTWVYPLRNNSPALDAAVQFEPFIPMDQRGAARPVDLPQIPNVGSGADIGAFERQLSDGETLPALAPTPLPAPAASPTPTPAASCADERLMDPGFEATINDGSANHRTNPYWPSTSARFLAGTLCRTGLNSCPVTAVSGPRTGSGWIWFDGVGDRASEIATVTQNVVLPAGMSGTFKFYMRFSEVAPLYESVMAVRLDGFTLQTFPEPATNEPQYIERSVPIPDRFFDGSVHSISFVYYRPTGVNHDNLMIDDASLIITCPESTPTPSPTPSPSPPSNISLSGRVITPSGLGLRGAVVRLTDKNGDTKSVSTSSLGYFAFDNVPAGQVSVSVSSRRYRFEPWSGDLFSSIAVQDMVGIE